MSLVDLCVFMFVQLFAHTNCIDLSVVLPIKLHIELLIVLPIVSPVELLIELHIVLNSQAVPAAMSCAWLAWFKMLLDLRGTWVLSGEGPSVQAWTFLVSAWAWG